jgi:MFS family permease
VSAPDNREPVSSYAWFALAVLFLAYVTAIVDRQALSLLVQPIKRDLGLDDIEVSLLQGFAFAVFLSLGVFPMGRLIDTRRRTGVLGAGLAAWSLMTAGCGLARSFPALFGFRVGVGVGEAVMTPSAYSLIGDYFPPRRLGLAMGLFSMGGYLGSGLALVFGAVVLANTPTGVVRLPLWGPVHGWQTVFLALGPPGLIVALLVAALREPPRRRANPSPPSWGDVRGYFAKARRPILLVNLAVGFEVMALQGTFAWLPALMARRFVIAPHVSGLALGPIVALAGAAGTLSAGIAGDLLRRRWPDGRLRLMGAAALLAAPLAILAATADSPAHLFLALGPALFCMTLATGSGPPALQEITPNRFIGLQHAFAVFSANMMGLGLGPTVVAVVTVRILHDEARLALSMATVTPVLLVAGAITTLVALNSYRRLAIDAWRTGGAERHAGGAQDLAADLAPRAAAGADGA